jgi:hypothetical protein
VKLGADIGFTGLVYRAGSQGAESRLIPGKNNLFLFYARENEARPHQKKHQWKC